MPKATVPPEVAKIALETTCAAILGFPLADVPPELREQLDRTLGFVASALGHIADAHRLTRTVVPGNVASLSEYLAAQGGRKR
jgi:hypothetical protein